MPLTPCEPPLVLASTSRYRRELMDRLRIPYAAVAPAYEEEYGLALPPDELVLVLAAQKAQSLAPGYPGTLILGSDQVAVFEGRVLGKPGSAARARAQLRALSGAVHRLVTGVALHDTRSGQTATALCVHTMRMRALDDAQIAAYVAHDAPFDCAGSYKVEALGIALFESIEGDDFTGIVGMPLTRVVALLTAAGVRVPR